MTLVCRATIGAVLACASGAPVLAQTADDPTQLSEIIVTATKRNMRIEDTDVSVTVLNREMLNEARIRDIRQLDALVPNVQFNESGQLGSSFISIRGIESNPFIVNRAAVYIDGIPFRELSNAVLNQVESVEVLRGPQGTLYGANSESGLIVINTRAPSANPGGEVRLTGTTYRGGEGLVADGFFAGPLIDGRLAGSIAFKVSDEDSFIQNIQPGAARARIQDRFVQGRLRWTPDDRLTVNGTAYILDTRAPGVFDQEYLPLDVRRYNETYAQRYNGGREAGRFTYVNDVPKLTDEQEVVAGVSAGYVLGYGRLDAGLSYRRRDYDSRGLDFDFTALPTAGGRDSNVKQFWNAEVRFSSPADQPFNYMVGASLYRQDDRRVLATFVGSGTLDSFVPAPEQAARGQDYGLFASANWAPGFLPDVTFSAGLRYDHARRESQQTAGSLDLGLGGVISYAEARLSGDFEAVLPRVSVRYQPSRTLTFYASASKGYIPGGFNLTAAQAGLDDDVLRYEAETMWSAETGFKWRTADGRMRLAGAAFSIRSDNWQEIQIATDGQGRVISSDYIGSDASIESKGFELEATYEPLDTLSLTANIGYADARYRDLRVDATTNLKGRRVKLVPEYDAYLAARYRIADDWYVRGEAAFTGEESLDARGRAVQPATTRLGLQAGYDGAVYSARLFIDNLTDVRRSSGLAFENLSLGSDGNWYSPLASSRKIGFEVGAKF